MRLLPLICLRTVLLLVALGASSGCATSFLYDRADRFATRYVDGHLELEAAQQEWLELRFEALHDWHRREQLPGYADWLWGLAARLDAADPLSAVELQGLGTELGLFWRELATHALPILTELAGELTDDQAAALVASLRSELEEQLADADRRSEAWRLQRRSRSMARLLRRIAGSLTRDQQAAIRSWARGQESTLQASLDNRAGWIDELELALAGREDREALARGATLLFVTPSERWPPQYEALVARNAGRTAEFLAKFLNELEPRQRERAVQRLERLATEFAELAAGRG